jgi:hypothetical protein
LSDDNRHCYLGLYTIEMEMINLWNFDPQESFPGRRTMAF